jgi:hypothetical protein
MLHRRHGILRISFCVLPLTLLSLGLFAQDFSAEFVNTGTDASNARPSKIYVGKDKMRIEGMGSGQFGTTAMIMDFANHRHIVLLPEQKVYLESVPAAALQKERMWFRPDDPNNACPQYEAMVKQYRTNNSGSFSCRKVGSDVVNGRSAIKYAGSSNNGTGYMWIDTQLRFPVKWQDDKGSSGELRNIHEGSQASSLFEVPSDYHKFDMQQMRRQPPQ